MSTDKKSGLSRSKILLLVGCLLAGVGLLLFSNISADSESKNVEAQDALVIYDEREYEEELVRKIKELCASVKGAGQTSVAVTLDGTYKAVYATDLQSGDSSKSEHVLVGSGSSQNALLVGYSPPEILGVGIVCEGGGNATVKAELIALVAAAFDMPMNKIYVTAS